MSPLLSFGIDSHTVSDNSWMPIIPSMTSVSSRATQEISPDLLPSRSFLSTSYSQEQGITDSMPSWPSSILYKPDMPPSSSTFSHLQNRTSDNHFDSPGSLISDKATESSISPPFRIPLPARSISRPNVKSPLLLDNAPQVDEFGRIIMTENATLSEVRQVRFKNTATFMSAPLLFPREGDVSITPPVSISSKDTFGNRMQDQDENELMTTSSSDAIVGDSSLAFDLQPGTPLLLECEPKLKGHDGGEEGLPLINDSPIFCFPALCQAVTALSPFSNRLSSLVTDHHSTNQSAKALLSPIELESEKLPERFAECPQSYRQDFQFEPWRSSRRISIAASKSDGKLSQYLNGHRKSILTRSRSHTTMEIGKDWHFPNPHASVHLGKQQVGQSLVQSPPRDENNECSTQESNASVRSIMKQQSIAMEKLAQAGFWQQKSDQSNKQEETNRDENGEISSLPQEEIVSKVSLWAWLLSSEAERGEGEEEEEEPMIRSTSPIDWQSDEEGDANHVYQKEVEKQETQEAASKSWEWLVSDDDFLQDSFKSAETIEEKKFGKDGDIGLGLQQSQRLVPDEIVVEQSKSVSSKVKVIPQLEDSPIVTTPELGQRESRTSAAIEALLTQVQKSHESPVAASRMNPVRRVGASYLYQQILNKISEEEDRSIGKIL